MNSEEEDSSIGRVDAATVPSSGLQGALNNPPPVERGEIAPSLSMPHSSPSAEPGQQQVRTIFDGEGSNNGSLILDAPIVRTNLSSEPASSDNSIHRVLSSGCASGESSVADQALKPPIMIGVKSRIFNGAPDIMSPSPSENQQQPGGSSQVAGSMPESMATRSRTLSMVDREVLVMREAVQLSSSTNPTPLGQQRRRSLFERAHSIAMPSSSDGTDHHDVLHAKSERSNSSAIVVVKGRNIDSIDLDASPSPRNDQSSHERDKYNTVLRDWLMHVVEKDDQHDAEVMPKGSMINLGLWSCRAFLLTHDLCTLDTLTPTRKCHERRRNNLTLHDATIGRNARRQIYQFLNRKYIISRSSVLVPTT